MVLTGGALIENVLQESDADNDQADAHVVSPDLGAIEVFSQGGSLNA
jgi:hypothetical protein